MGQVTNRVGTRRGDSELLWGPGISLTPGWALVSTWLALKGPLDLVKGRTFTLLWGPRPRHRMRRIRKAERKEIEVERETQKGREKNRPKTESPRGTAMKTEAGLGWGKVGNRRHSGRGSLIGPDPMRQLHWGPWRKSLSQSLISRLFRGAGQVAGPSVPV